MNRIRIYEQDATTTGVQDLSNFDVVYVPGFVQDLDSNESLMPPYTPKLCTSVKEFETYFGKYTPIFDEDQPYPEYKEEIIDGKLVITDGFSEDAIPSTNMFNANDPDPSYIYAKELIRAGLPVVYERMNVYMTPNAVPTGGTYDLTVKHMYDKLKSVFSDTHIGSGSTTIKDCDVTVNGETFAEKYNSVAGEYNFTYVDITTTQVTSATCSDTSVTVSVDESDFKAAYPNPNTYVFTEIADIAESTTITDATVEVDDATFLATDYGTAGSHAFTYVNTPTPSATGSTEITGVTAVEVDADTFIAAGYVDAQDYTFVYETDGAEAAWTYNGNPIPDLATIGITLTGTYELADNNDITITVSYTDNYTWQDASGNVVTLATIGITLTDSQGNATDGSQIIVVVTLSWQTGTETVDLEEIGITLSDDVDVGTTITIVLEQLVVNMWQDTNSRYFDDLKDLGITLSSTSSLIIGDTVTTLLYVSDPLLLDKGEYSIKYLTSGGYPTFEYNVRAISQKMATLCERRGDCIALIDHTNNVSRSLIGPTSVYEVAKSQAYMLDDNTDTFSAMFTPWGNFALVNAFNTDADVIGAQIQTQACDLPPSYAYLITLANSIQINPNWLAIAGATRGKVRNLLTINSNQILTNSIADSYQSDTDICINPITNIKPYGQCIWGNRTLADNSNGSTALSFLNLRNLVNDIKKNLFTSCQSLLFEQNTDVLWVKFLSRVTPQLDQMVTGAGISGYKVIKGAPSDKTLITATVIIYPIYAVEQFEITVYLTDNELSVSEV